MTDALDHHHPFSLTRAATLWWFDGEWEPVSRCYIKTIERLPGCDDIPRDARPFCSSFEVTFYDRTGNRVLIRGVRCHGTEVNASPMLICVEGVWFEMQCGHVIYRDGTGWCIEREAARNTHMAHMANAGFYAFHHPESWIRPIRWLFSRIAYAIRCRARSLRSHFRREGSL